MCYSPSPYDMKGGNFQNTHKKGIYSPNQIPHEAKKDKLPMCKQQSISFPAMGNIHSQVQLGREPGQRLDGTGCPFGRPILPFVFVLLAGFVFI